MNFKQKQGLLVSFVKREKYVYGNYDNLISSKYIYFSIMFLNQAKILINIHCTLLSQPFSYLDMYCSWCYNWYLSFNAVT